MVTDPHTVLDVPADANDDAVRRRYLELVRAYPPDQHPEKFAQVRAAYEALKDSRTRLQQRLFKRAAQDSFDALIQELACRSPRRRVSLETLLQVVQAQP